MTPMIRQKALSGAGGFDERPCRAQHLVVFRVVRAGVVGPNGIPGSTQSTSAPARRESFSRDHTAP